jgi:L-asparaginase/Glu-tRNA(Gln) amidotransferase subunit D
MEKGKTNLAAYQPGKMLLDLGAVSNHDMTAEASITKLMWLAKNCESPAAIKKGFETDLVGELTLPKSN